MAAFHTGIGPTFRVRWEKFIVVLAAIAFAMWMGYQGAFHSQFLLTGWALIGLGLLAATALLFVGAYHVLSQETHPRWVAVCTFFAGILLAGGFVALFTQVAAPWSNVFVDFGALLLIWFVAAYVSTTKWWPNP
ncbi:MAG TPA: hypothetical protein VMR34_04170 [Candidatus Saccharimonadales bacterium]|nr:hypothetical protein [Candidatus Saccharimonadales bacterium]